MHFLFKDFIIRLSQLAGYKICYPFFPSKEYFFSKDEPLQTANGAQTRFSNTYCNSNSNTEFEFLVFIQD